MPAALQGFKFRIGVADHPVCVDDTIMTIVMLTKIAARTFSYSIPAAPETVDVRLFITQVRST